MNDKGRVFKNTLALMFAKVGQLIGNLVFVFYFSRVLQVEGFGIYVTVMAVFQMSSLGCSVGLPTFIPRELSKDITKTNLYLIHGILIALLSTVLVIGVLSVVVPHLSYLPQTKLGIYIISTALIPLAVDVVLSAIFVTHQKAIFITFTVVINVLGRLLLSVLFLHLGYGVIGLIVAYTFFEYLSLFAKFYFFVRYIIKPQWEFSWSFLRNMLRDLRIFVGLAVLGALFSQAEVIILSLVGGEAEVGFYSAARKLVVIWSMISASYMTVVFPILTSAYQKSWRKAMTIQNQSLKYLFAVAFPLAVGMAVIADRIVLLFYGPGFEKSAYALQLLSFGMLIEFLNQVLWRILLARNEQNLVLRGQFIADVSRALLALGLAPRLGYLGATLALIGSNLIYAVYHAYYVQRGGTSLPLLKLVGRLVVISVLLSVVLLIFEGWFHVFVLVPLTALIYFVLIVVFRVFSPDELMLFRQILKPRDVSLETPEVSGITRSNNSAADV